MDRRDRKPTRGKTLFPAVALLIFSLLWTTGLTVWPRPDQPVAAIFPPFLPAERALTAAAGAGAEAVLAFGGWRSVILARSSDPNFIGRLYAAGAWAVLRAPAKTNCML
jgi:hypothetical protein